MTSELAALLDGPVAERFGRPTDAADFAMYWEGDGVVKSWVWNDPAVGDIPSDLIPDTTASALWLAHLLDQCRERGWCISFIQPGNIVCVFEDGCIGTEWDGPTRLEAFCRAMLAVPVEVKP